MNQVSNLFNYHPLLIVLINNLLNLNINYNINFCLFGD